MGVDVKMEIYMEFIIKKLWFSGGERYKVVFRNRI